MNSYSGDNDSDEDLIRKALGMQQEITFENQDMLDDHELDELSFENHEDTVPLEQSPHPNAKNFFSKDSSAGYTLTRRCPTVIYLSCDPEFLSEYQCLVKKQIELFEANEADIQAGAQGRNKPIVLGQVGIRCRHCSFIPLNQRGRSAVFYPSKLLNIYQASQNIATHHLQDSCTHIPASLKQELCSLKDTKSRAGSGKDHWAKATASLGVYDDEHGLRFTQRVYL